jgi:hypothetical protein
MTRNRAATWHPSSRKALLRRLAMEEKFTDPATGKIRRPRDNLELLRAATDGMKHPGRLMTPDPTRTLGGVLRSQNEADQEKWKEELRELGRRDPEALGDLYKARAESLDPNALRPKSAAPSASTRGKNERPGDPASDGSGSETPSPD